jgi:hypothetical protein
MENRKKIAKAVKRTLQNKFPKQKRTELKGSKQSIEVKRYFYRHIESVPFEIYALTLNKRRVYDNLSQKKDRVYNFIARKVLDVIPFTNVSVRVGLVIDRSKSKKEIKEFDDYLIRQLSGRIEPRIPLDIDHHLSHEICLFRQLICFPGGFSGNTKKMTGNGLMSLMVKLSMMMFICHKKERALWVRALWLCQPTEGNTKGTHSGLTAHL